MLVPVAVFNPIYAIAFLILFTAVSRWKWLDALLFKLGGQSTNMWLVHTFFCYYLFREFIYSFKYPLVIFAVTMLASYFSGVLIDAIYKPVQRRIKR